MYMPRGHEALLRRRPGWRNWLQMSFELSCPQLRGYEVWRLESKAFVAVSASRTSGQSVFKGFAASIARPLQWSRPTMKRKIKCLNSHPAKEPSSSICCERKNGDQNECGVCVKLFRKQGNTWFQQPLTPSNCHYFPLEFWIGKVCNNPDKALPPMNFEMVSPQDEQSLLRQEVPAKVDGLLPSR